MPDIYALLAISEDGQGLMAIGDSSAVLVLDKDAGIGNGLGNEAWWDVNAWYNPKAIPTLIGAKCPQCGLDAELWRLSAPDFSTHYIVCDNGCEMAILL
jgi:hypothetical protein